MDISNTHQTGTKPFDLPAEIIDEIIGYLDCLTFEEFKDLRKISPSLERHHLVLSNISDSNDIEYFTPGKYTKTPFYFKSVKGLTKILNSHIRRHALEPEEITLFIEYQEAASIPFYNWYMDVSKEDPGLMQKLNNSTHNNFDGDSELYQLLQVLTGMMFNIEIYLRSVFTPFNFRYAISNGITVILDHRTVPLNSYPFLLKPDNWVLQMNGLRPPWKTTRLVDIKIYIFDPICQKPLTLKTNKALQAKCWDDERDQFMGSNNSMEVYEYGKGLVIDKLKNVHPDIEFYNLHKTRIERLANTKVNTRIIPMLLNDMEFKMLRKLTMNTFGTLILKNCNFPVLEEFKLLPTPLRLSKGFPQTLCIMDNSFPKLKRLHISHKVIKKFSGNKFIDSFIEELVLDTKFHNDFIELICNTKKLKINGYSCMCVALLRVLKAIASLKEYSQLEQMILSDFSFGDLQSILNCQNDAKKDYELVQFTNLKTLKIDSVNECNTLLKFSPKTFERFNQILNTNPQEMEKNLLDLKSSCPNLENLYLLNCNIPEIIKPGSLKSIIYSEPSPMDDHHRYTRFTSKFDNDTDFKPTDKGLMDFSEDCIIYKLNIIEEELEKVELMSLENNNKRKIWFCGKNIKLGDDESLNHLKNKTRIFIRYKQRY